MKAPGFSSRALAGGYDLDTDLPVPDVERGTFAGLHAVRHLRRFLDSLGLGLVLTGDDDSELWWDLASDYDETVERREYRSLRRVTSASGLRAVLRNEPRTVPLLGMNGSTCVGWSSITWEGVRLSERLHPGQLIALVPRMVSMSSRADPFPHRLHLMAWQEPFPTHSLVTWDEQAGLCDGPHELDDHVQEAGAWMFQNGSPFRTGARSQRRA